MVDSAGEALVAFHVAEQDGRLVGYLDGVLPGEDNPTRTGVGGVWVRPDSRGCGIGSGLWDYLRPRAAARGVRRLTSHVEASDEASLRWLATQGATTGGTHLESMLMLGDDLPLVPPPVGVAVAILADDADENVWRSAYEAHVRRARDAPDAETNPTPMRYPMYRTLLSEESQVCLATTEDGVVGLTSVFPRNQKERLVNTMITAVNREWRGKGLATALKTAHALKLRDAGWRAIVTQNMEGNDHILAANKLLGFQPKQGDAGCDLRLFRTVGLRR